MKKNKSVAIIVVVLLIIAIVAFFLLTNIWSVYIIYYIICTGGVCYE